MFKRYILVFFALMTMLPAYAQVGILFIPEVYGRSVNGLLECKIISNRPRFSAFLTVTVSEQKEGRVCMLRTGELSIAQGTNAVSAVAAKASNIQFSNSRLARTIALSKLFPAGEYEYCFTLTVKNSDGDQVEQCFSYSLMPFNDMSLLEPFNTDTICNRRPVLSWQPLLPNLQGTFYQVVLAEIKAGQNATEALNYNLPLVNQRGVQTPALPYPAIARELEEGKRYAWQVTAYKEQTILSRSEVWEFGIGCNKEPQKVKDESDDGYRDIRDNSLGSFYIAKGKLKLMIINPYEAQELKYEIYPVVGDGSNIKRLPKVKLENGRNLVAIDLQEIKGLLPKRYYVIKVFLANGDQKNLRFLYEKNN